MCMFLHMSACTDIHPPTLTHQLLHHLSHTHTHRVFSSGVFSKTVDWICEDYMRVEDNGNVMICRQYSKYMPDNSTCSQYLIGRKLGPTPPPKGHKHH